MSQPTTIYATFQTEHAAEAALAALRQHGLAAQDVSILRPRVRPDHPADAFVAPDAFALSESVRVSPSEMPADLPVPDVGVIAPSITAAVEMNTGTRIGEDASSTRNSPGYPYEAQDIEGQDALASASNAPSTHAALNISLANVPTHEAILTLLKAHGAMSVQLF